MTQAGYPAVSEPPAPVSNPPAVDTLHRKLLALTGARMLVGTALLGATAWLTLGSSEELLRGVEGLLYGIIASIYLGSLISIFFLRAGRYLKQIAYAQIAGDVAAATALVYLTGGAESIFTILYPLAIVNGAIGLSRRGAYIASGCSALAFLLLVVATEKGFISSPVYTEHPAIATPRLLLTLAANLSAFLLTAALAGYLADALVGARSQLRREEEKRERAESELSALSALHQNITRSISSGILTIDGAQRITYLNPAGEEIAGRKLPEVQGRSLRELFPALARAVVEERQEGRGETVLERADGSHRVIGFSLAPLVDAGTPSLPGFVAVFQDLTGLRRMEEQMRRADRLAAVGQLAAGLAHEIRNPLASMSGSIELLAGNARLDDKDRRLMQIVLRESERLELLVRDFLNFARPKQTELARVTLAPLVEEVLQVFEGSAKHALSLSRELDGGAAVRGDEAQLRQVLWNLLRNAADAVSSGGEVKVGVLARDGEVRLEVKDTGVGIGPEERARIFEPFFSTKERGSGLGLATVHRIIEAHGGRIELESEPGRGSTFSVILPAAA